MCENMIIGKNELKRILEKRKILESHQSLYDDVNDYINLFIINKIQYGVFQIEGTDDKIDESCDEKDEKYFEERYG